MGGLIGYGDNPQLIDGGFLSAPSLAFGTLPEIGLLKVMH